jgi:hypothetical protein
MKRRERRQIWVYDEFAEMLKIESARAKKPMLEFTRELAQRDNRRERRGLFDGFRI